MGPEIALASTIKYSTVQYNTIQYSTVQYSTVQYSTVQYSTNASDWSRLLAGSVSQVVSSGEAQDSTLLY